MIESHQEALAMLTVLANHFEVPVPVLRWAPRKRRNSHYKPGLRRITLAAGRHPSQWEPSLVHEFAHHLQYCKKFGSAHDQQFWQMLWLVADQWYGQFLNLPEGAKAYPWDHEYKTGQWLAKNGFHRVMEVLKEKATTSTTTSAAGPSTPPAGLEAESGEEK